MGHQCRIFALWDRVQCMFIRPNVDCPCHVRQGHSLSDQSAVQALLSPKRDQIFVERMKNSVGSSSQMILYYRILLLNCALGVSMLEARRICHSAGNRLSSDWSSMRLRCDDRQGDAHGGGSTDRVNGNEGRMRSRSGAKRESRACAEYDELRQDLS